MATYRRLARGKQKKAEQKIGRQAGDSGNQPTRGSADTTGVKKEPGGKNWPLGERGGELSKGEVEVLRDPAADIGEATTSIGGGPQQ